MAKVNASGLYYPLTKMNFLVTIDDIADAAAFSEVTGIEAAVDVIEFRQGNSHSLAPVKIPGLVKHGNITLKMGYVRDQAFKTWVKDCVNERRPINKRRTVTIEMMDLSTEASPSTLRETTSGTLVWILNEAWVAKYTGPDLNASTSEVAIESVEIAYEEMVIPN